MNKLIKDLCEKDHLEAVVLLQHVSKGVTNNQAYYLNLVLQDKSGSIDARYWNVTEEIMEGLKPGVIVKVYGDVINHRSLLQLKVGRVEMVDQKQFDIKQFMKCGPYSEEQLKVGINRFVDMIKDHSLSIVTKSLLADYEQDFYTYPAAMKNHHDYYGGLATHVLGMLKINEAICEQYPLLDKDLMIAGIIVHDMGKLFELSGALGCSYTIEGNLIGHISIMQSKLEAKLQQLNIDDEKTLLLRHMILSHHGKNEFGSPILPMIPEAEMLYLLDNIDARMQSFEKVLASQEEGSFSPRIFALENRMVYKMKNEHK